MLTFWIGLNALDQLIKGCETVSLQLEEVGDAAATPPASITGVPAPTGTGSGFLTGVTAPANATGTGSPTPSNFPGAASQIKFAGSLFGAGAVAAAAAGAVGGLF